MAAGGGETDTASGIIASTGRASSGALPSALCRESVLSPSGRVAKLSTVLPMGADVRESNNGFIEVALYIQYNTFTDKLTYLVVTIMN